MIKEVKKERTAACAYYLSGLDPVDRKKMPVSIEKRADRITIILKGKAIEKKRKRKIIKEILYGRNVKYFRKLFSDVYELMLTKSSFAGLDLIMNRLRKNDIIAHHAYKPLGKGLTLYNLTDKIMIRFIVNANQDQIDNLLAKYKLIKLYTSVPVNNKGKTIVAEVTSQSGADTPSGIKVPKGRNPVKIANLLEKEQIVDTAEVSLIYRLPVCRKKRMTRKKEQEEKKDKEKAKDGIKTAIVSRRPRLTTRSGSDTKGDFEPADTFFKKQWYLHFHENVDSDGNSITEDSDVKAVKAWEILNGGGDKEIVIAIIDLSIDIDHPDLKDRLAQDIETIKRKFVFTSLGNVTTDADLNKGDSHGTKCAGIALAEKNEQGIVGVAYGCSFLPVWIDGTGGEELMIRCLDEVSKVAHVISYSLAPLPEDLKNEKTSILLSEKLTEVARFGGPRGNGCVICVSAGNYQVPINGRIEEEGFEFHRDLGGEGMEIAKGERIFNPYAANPDVIAVTASTSTGSIAAYNNFGAEISVCAPSANWNPPVGMNKLTSAGICTTAPLDGNLDDGGGLYSDRFGGTSAAAPLVAGIAALVLSANKDLPATIVKKILEVTTDKIDFNNTGREKYDNNGHSRYYGFGKVNAAKAVQLAIDLKNKNKGGNSITISQYMKQINELGRK